MKETTKPSIEETAKELATELTFYDSYHTTQKQDEEQIKYATEQLINFAQHWQEQQQPTSQLPTDESNLHVDLLDCLRMVDYDEYTHNRTLEDTHKQVKELIKRLEDKLDESTPKEQQPQVGELEPTIEESVQMLVGKVLCYEQLQHLLLRVYSKGRSNTEKEYQAKVQKLIEKFDGAFDEEPEGTAGSQLFKALKESL